MLSILALAFLQNPASSIVTHPSPCGANLTLWTDGAPLSNEQGEGEISSQTGTPPDHSPDESKCVCFDMSLQTQAGGSTPAIALECENGGELSDNGDCDTDPHFKCNTGCQQMPIIDEDADGESWPQGDEVLPPEMDTDGDNIPNHLDLIPGDGSINVGGLIPNGTGRDELIVWLLDHGYDPSEILSMGADGDPLGAITDRNGDCSPHAISDQVAFVVHPQDRPSPPRQ